MAWRDVGQVHLANKCSACRGTGLVATAGEYTTEKCRECTNVHIAVSRPPMGSEDQGRCVDGPPAEKLVRAKVAGELAAILRNPEHNLRGVEREIQRWVSENS